MKRLLLLALLAGCGAPQTPPAATVAAPAKPKAPGLPAAIAVEGVPAVPDEITKRLAQYQSARGAAFEDFGPDGSILIATRFAETAQLHLVPFPGGRREQLTFGDEPVSGGLFIPGTSDLLYTQARGGDENYQIYRLDRKQGRSSLLTDGKSRNNLGPMSRKGDRVAYSSNRRNGRDTDLYLLDLSTGTARLLLETKGTFWVVTDWAPNDTELMMLKVVSVNDTRPYTLNLSHPIPESVLDVPDNVKVSCSSPKFAYPTPWIMGCDWQGEFRQLAQSTGKVSAAFRHLTIVDKPWDVTDIEVHDRQIAYVKNEDGTSRLYFLGEDRPVDLPLGIVSGMRFSRDGKRLGFTLSRADAPSDAYTYEIAEKKLVRWTFSETGGLDASAFVTPQRFSFKSFDQREIPAYVYKPRKAGKAPVVISIHGGPESQYQPFFTPLTQYWVNELGIAVIAPNVRGSTGYGKTYTALDNAEKREDSVKDIGALLDWIAAQPDLDASRVAVFGGSYGGYMVLASLVHFGDRLKAGIDVVGIANFVTFLERTSGYRVDLRRVEYGDERDPKMRAVFERISPANHADRIRSALLVAHGRNDPRVPFSEAEQIAAKVRAQGRPVWTVYADNEGHGFARKENRDYLSAAMTLFLKKHLME
ncbi:MAG: S9 family peptidase [Planctomycetes bacterium]|nr:S9 family peptidase [Planctomycetota bacterium]